MVAEALAASPEGRWLDATSAIALVTSFCVPVVPTSYAASPAEAVAAAGAPGYPVAVKAAGGEVVHKTDVGGARLGLASPEQVARAFSDMATRLGLAMGGAVVQPMAGPGVETILGLAQDPLFGPLVMFGLGGVATDLLGDRAFRLLPLTEEDASDLIGSVKAAPLLRGYRGSPVTDEAALRDVLLRVALLAEELPEVAELDLNPVLATPEGALALDVKVRLRPRPTGPDPLLRRLR
ncbi:MAG: acetate--CoA ligase family protein [Acidimicrobiales bacterium]